MNWKSPLTLTPSKPPSDSSSTVAASALRAPAAKTSPRHSGVIVINPSVRWFNMSVLQDAKTDMKSQERWSGKPLAGGAVMLARWLSSGVISRAGMS